MIAIKYPSIRNFTYGITVMLSVSYVMCIDKNVKYQNLNDALPYKWTDTWNTFRLTKIIQQCIVFSRSVNDFSWYSDLHIQLFPKDSGSWPENSSHVGNVCLTLSRHYFWQIMGSVLEYQIITECAENLKSFFGCVANTKIQTHLFMFLLGD